MAGFTAADIWDDLKPKIDALIASRVRSTTTASSSTGGVSISAHALNGSSHTGTLGSDQAPQFLLRDGSRSLSGNLSVDSGVTVDGVDISAHAANPDAHHATATAGDGINLSGQQISLASSVAGAGLAYSSGVLSVGAGYGLAVNANDVQIAASAAGAGLTYTTGVLAVGAGLGMTVNADDVALTTPGTLTVSTSNASAGNHTHAITSSSAPGAAASLLASSALGALTLPLLTATTSLTTPLIAADVSLSIAPAVNINLDPVGDVVLGDSLTFRTNAFSTFYPIEGAILAETSVAGQYGFTVGVIAADELRTRIFVADEVRIDRGEEVWSKSYGIVAEDFTTPGSIGGTVTVTFESSPMVSGALFSTNDWLLFRTIDIDSGVVLSSVWGQVSGYTATNIQPFWNDLFPDNGWPDSSFPSVDLGTTTQDWTFTLRSGDTNYRIPSGQLGIDYGASGQSYIAFSVTDPIAAPFIRIRRWAGANPYTPANHDDTVYIGNLTGIAGGTGDRGIWTQSSDGTAWAELSDSGVILRNSGIDLYSGATRKVHIGSDGTDFWMGVSSSDKRLSWDGSTLSIVGAITITGGNAAKTDFSNITATLDAVGDGSTYKRTTANQRDGGGYGYTGLNSSGYVKLPVRGSSISGSPATGLNLTSTHMGYYDGAAWKTWIASTGQFYFGGSSGAHLEWDGTYLKGVNSSSGVEWQASSLDGLIYAGGTVIGSHGIRFDHDIAASTYDLAWEYGGVTGGYIRGSYDLSDWLGIEIYSTTNIDITGVVAITGNVGITGTVSITGNVGLLDGYYIAADKMRARDSGGLRLEDDAGNLGLFVEDSTGDVGVGHNSPAYRLDTLVASGADRAVLRAGVSGVSNGLTINYTHSSTTLAYCFLDGAVGVNTSSITSGVKLDVNGQIYARAAVTFDGGVYIKTVSAPSTPPAGYCVLYHDTSDGDFKIKFPNGTTATLATN